MEIFTFYKAGAIWAKGREKEKNCELAFRTVLAPGEAILSLAASTIYRIWINGIFVGAGPARAAHGWYVVDQFDLTKYLSGHENVLVIEVVGYNVNTYDTLDQTSFLTAEVMRNGELLSYTGDGKIEIYDLHKRIQKVQRYSFQRGFAECYKLRVENAAFYTQAHWDGNSEPCADQGIKKYVRRRARMPQYERLHVSKLCETGTVDFDYRCFQPFRDRAYRAVGELIKGYDISELEEHLSEEAQNMSYRPGLTVQDKLFPLALCNGYGLYEFPFNATGFLKIGIQCKEACTIYVLFDEILCDGKLKMSRIPVCNCFKYTLDAGLHSIMTFAPYTMKYVQVAVKGCATVMLLDMVEYKHPPAAYTVNLPDDTNLKRIYQAALETYRANAVDLFTDCPSRERAGWLCDSFFTARVEYVLTGESVLERVFLENFLEAGSFAGLPKGMLPMCYPADHPDGNFIPNFAMWFVLELEEYYLRSNDRSLIDRAKEPVYELLNYFSKFENEYGLLENLEKWVFVEWSRANAKDVVQDVNFPSNMLYVKMLHVISKLYGDVKLEQKAKHLRAIIRERSLQGVFFTDNERRTMAGLSNPGNRTEVCQYFAFFTGVATKQEDSELWNILCKDFGYQRKETGLYPEIAFANAFIGNYLRIELLYQDGQYEEVLNNICGYFTKMAEQTGTLWEHDNPSASCNHGYASHVIYWLAGIYKTRRT